MRRSLAALWLLVVLAAIGHNLWHWVLQGRTPSSDLLAMLPRDEQRPLVGQATQALADASARRVSVLIGGAGWPEAQLAADAFIAVLDGVRLRHRVADAEQVAWLDFYTPARGALLDAVTREHLQTTSPDVLADQAAAGLYQPLGAPRFGAWAGDPLNTLGQWFSVRGQASRVRVRDGRLMLTDPEALDRHYALVLIEMSGSGFEISAQRELLPRLAAAESAARGTGALVVRAGVPLFAAAASEQAQAELHTIGLGSLLGIVALTLLAFRSLRPRLLVTLSMAVGLVVGASTGLLVFGELHLITLVFGASLLGVAENYGSNYFSVTQGLAGQDRQAMLARQSPVMTLAMATTVIGYALLALPPFPGLRQIAVFSGAGLLAAFLTVLWWFPLLDARTPPSPTRFAQWLGAQRARWPVMSQRGLSLLVLVLLTLAAVGASRLQFNDDIRQLQSAPPALMAEQREFARLMQAPGVAQFFVVQGADVQQVLEREEALVARLRSFSSGVQAISDALPSRARQQADAALLTATHAALAPRVSERLEQSVRLTAVSPQALTLEAWLASPVSEPLRGQWLGKIGATWASAVLVRTEPGDATKLSALASTLPGVIWVDKLAEVSALMQRYRVLMGAVLGLGLLLTWGALAVRFGRRAWRALMPTALAGVLTVGLLSLLGQSLQLFHVLPLLILLGLGVDYGIFLLEQPGRQETRPFLSVSLAAACTLLSFGLLALSGTPALRAFGLTLALGVPLAWLLTPFFLPPEHD